MSELPMLPEFRVVHCVRPRSARFHVVPAPGNTVSLAASCGHEIHQFEQITDGRRCVKTIKARSFAPWSLQRRKVRRRCTSCTHRRLLNLGIVCVRCGEFIAPGELITIHPVGSEGLRFAKQAVRLPDGSGLLGCWRPGTCSPTPLLAAGHWVGNGVSLLITPGVVLTPPPCRVHHARDGSIILP